METQGKAVLFQPSRLAKGIYLIMALPAGYLLYSFIESIGWPWAIPLILWLVGWLAMGRDYRFLEGKADATPDEVAVLRLLVPFGRTPECWQRALAWGWPRLEITCIACGQRAM